MKTAFRKILYSALVTLVTVGSVIYASCNKDKCKSIVCAYGGVCDGGKCICKSGYEGPTCQTISRDKFIGAWAVYEKGSITEAAQYPVAIERSNNITDVVIINFYNYFRNPVKAYIIKDTIYIPNQQLEGHVVFGQGVIYSNTTYGQYGSISMRYEVIDTATNVPNDFGYYAPDLSEPSAWNK
jgi:hypothetical protein